MINEGSTGKLSFIFMWPQNYPFVSNCFFLLVFILQGKKKRTFVSKKNLFWFVCTKWALIEFLIARSMLFLAHFLFCQAQSKKKNSTKKNGLLMLPFKMNSSYTNLYFFSVFTQHRVESKEKPNKKPQFFWVRGTLFSLFANLWS